VRREIQSEKRRKKDRCEIERKSGLGWGRRENERGGKDERGGRFPGRIRKAVFHRRVPRDDLLGPTADERRKGELWKEGGRRKKSDEVQNAPRAEKSRRKKSELWSGYAHTGSGREKILTALDTSLALVTGSIQGRMI